MPTPFSNITEHILRIPVKGPSPNNTLAFVKSTMENASWGRIYQTRGALRAEIVVPTSFVLDGFSQRTATVLNKDIKVSVSAMIGALGSNSDGLFIGAVDNIRWSFDETGRFWIYLDICSKSTANIYIPIGRGLYEYFKSIGAGEAGFTAFTASAYILCYEPPV